MTNVTRGIRSMIAGAVVSHRTSRLVQLVAGDSGASPDRHLIFEE